MLPFTDLPESLRRYQRLPKLEVLTSHLDDEAQRKPQRAASELIPLLHYRYEVPIEQLVIMARRSR